MRGQPDTQDDPAVSTELATLPPMVLARHDGHPPVVDDIAEIAAGQRARRLPYRAGAATGATGLAAWGLVEATAAVGQPSTAGSLFLAVVVGTVAALLALRLRFRDRVVTDEDGDEVERIERIPTEFRRRWWIAGCLAALWIVLVAAGSPVVGPGTMAAVLAGGGAALSARWMRVHPVPLPVDRPDEPEPVVEPPHPPRRPQVPMDPASVAYRRWYERVSPEVGPAIVAGGLLTEREDLLDATRWVGETPPGSTTFADVYARRARIAAALEVAIDDVLIERIKGDESRFQFTLVTRDHLEEGVPYPGPQYRDGRVPVGVYADGGEPVYWTFWKKKQGVRNGASLGQMGSGKTALMELGLLGLRSAEAPDGRGYWKTWWGDGDEQGSSSNLAEDAADWFESEPEGLLRQLAAFEALLDARGDLKHLLTDDPETGEPIPRTSRLQKVLREFKPCPDYPGYMWFLPELGTLLANEELKAAQFGPRLCTVLRRHRKFGIGVAIDTQSGTDRDFGNDGILKGFLTMSNAFCMRSTNVSEQYMIGKLTVSPGELPDTGGYGYLAGGGRLARFRTAWVDNLHDYLAGLPVCEDDPDAADAIRPYLPVRDPEESLKRRQERMEARRAAARAGTPLGTPAPTPAAAEPAKPARWGSAGGATFGDPSTVGAPVAQIADYRPTPVRRAVAPMSAYGALPDRPERILAAMRTEPARVWRTRELAEDTGIPLSAVSSALTKHLVPRGLVHSPDGVQGRYVVGAAGETPVA